MGFDVRYNNHPADVKNYDTKTLRERFLFENVFIDNQKSFCYSHHDRIIFGGIKPINKSISLPNAKELGTSFFLERREMGVINIGGAGKIIVDGKTIAMKTRDGLYIPKDSKNVLFSSDDENNPAKYYITSAPAHLVLPLVHIPLEKANSRPMGSSETLNKRTIYQYLHPNVLKTSQLSMGMTFLDAGSAWNTMPVHTHERRMEVYFYFNFAENHVVFHMMGEKDETRHIIVKSEQAVISPSWSIHSGVGTTNYTFIWGMCGENLNFDDMDNIETKELK